MKKLQPRYVKLICYGLGILFLLISIFVIKPSLDDKHDELQAVNDQLSAELTQIEGLEANMATYEEQSKTFQEEDAEILSHFPAEVRPEDVILFAKDLQDKTDDLKVNSIGVTAGNLIYAMNTAPVEAPPVEETTTEENADAEATGAEAAVDPADEAGIDASLGIIDEASVVKPDYNLFQMAVSYDFNTSYRDLKTITGIILDCEDKQNISGVSLSFDEQTGKLIGNFNVNRYYLTGTDKEYESPDAGSIKKGTSNIFGTIDGPAKN